MLDAALAAEMKTNGIAADLDMAIAQSGQPVGTVLLGVARVADADQGVIEQLDHRGQHLLPAVYRQRKMLLQRGPQRRQCLAECQQAGVLVGIPHLAPARVITVLLAPPRIAAGGLQMAVGIGADPHVGVGGRDCQRVDARHVRGVADALALRIEVSELAAQLAAGDAGGAVVDVMQAGGEGWGVGHGERPVGIRG